MWKKLFICVLSLISMFSMVYMMDQKLIANEVSSEVDTKLGKKDFATSFMLGGLNWQPISVDYDTGYGYAISDPVKNGKVFTYSDKIAPVPDTPLFAEYINNTVIPEFRDNVANTIDPKELELISDNKNFFEDPKVPSIDKYDEIIALPGNDIGVKGWTGNDGAYYWLTGYCPATRCSVQGSSSAEGAAVAAVINPLTGNLYPTGSYINDSQRIRMVLYLKLPLVEKELSFGDKQFIKTPQAPNTEFYETTKNVKNQDLIGNAQVAQEGKIFYSLESSTNDAHKDDFTKFKFAGDTNRVLVNSPDGLDIGPYEFRIRIYNDKGRPTPAIDVTGNIVNEFDKGIISNNIELMVYPSESQISYIQDRNLETEVFYTVEELNALSVGSKLGTIDFTNSEAIQEKLFAKGYTIKNVELMEPGTIIPISQLECRSNLDTSYEIEKKNQAIFSNQKINFDLLITFEKDGIETAVLRKDSQEFQISKELKYANPDKAGEFLSGDTYEYTFNPATSASNQFILTATDKASASAPNINVTYCIWNTNTKECGTSSAVKLGTGSTIGTQKVIAQAPGTSDQSVVIRAMIKDDSNNVVNFKDLNITVHPAVQSLKWIGIDIQNTGNHISAKAGTSDTWKLALRYSGSGTDHYAIEELISSDTSTAGKIGIQSNILSGTPTYVYSLKPSNSADSSKVSLTGSTLHISGVPTGNINLEVESASVGNYAKSSKFYLEVKIADKIDITYSPLYTNDTISMSSEYAKKNTKIADLSMDPTSETGFSYEIEKIVSNDIELTGTFLIPSGSSEVKVGSSNLSAGVYEVTFKATKGIDTVSKIVTITVSEADYDTSTWSWKKEQSSANYQPIGGSLNETTKINSTTWTETYEPTTPKKSMRVKLDGLPTNSYVKEYVLDGTTTGVISVTSNRDYATITFDGASPQQSDVLIKATVADTSATYSEVEAYLPVTIEKYPQVIKFKDSKVLFLPDNAPCTEAEVEKNSTYWNESIANPVTLSSTSNAFRVEGKNICPILGKTDTNVSLTAHLPGDRNYNSAPAVTRSVTIYKPGTITISKSIEKDSDTKENVVYTPGTLLEALNESTSNPQGTAKFNEIVANVKLSGVDPSSSTPYKLSTNTGTDNFDKDLFSVLPNGNITIKDADGIRASDIVNHGGNIYKIQVDVTDIHGFSQTVNLHIKIDDAQPDFFFTNDRAEELPKNELYYDGITSVSRYDVSYVKDGTIDLYTNYFGAVKYSVDNIDESQSSDVISQTDVQEGSSQFTIAHATELDGSNLPVKKAYAKACREQGNGFKEKCIYSVVHVEKAIQTLKFAANPLKLGKETKSLIPQYTGHADGEPVLITNSTNPLIVHADAFVQGQREDQSISTGTSEGSATLTAYAQGNRDYQDADTTTLVEITNKPPTTLRLEVTPSTSIIYGEINANATIKVGYISTKPAYFWSDDETIIEVSDDNINDNESDMLEIHKVGSTIINVCQTADPTYIVGNACPAGDDYGYIQITVSKAPLTLKLSNQSIYTGQALPTYVFEPNPVNGSFQGNDQISDFPIPNSTRTMDGLNILTNSNTPGTYFIKGSYSTAEASAKIIENYNVSMSDGTLTIKQDASKPAWFHLENPLDDTILTPEPWFNHAVHVVLDETTEEAGLYNQISLDQTTWKSDLILVDQEGEHSKDVWFRINPTGTETNAGAFATKQSTTIKIDKTDPKVKSITGTPANKDAISQIINTITFGKFFKPGTKVEILSEDSVPNGVNKGSGLKSIDYKVYEIDRITGSINTTPMNQGSLTPDAQGKAEVTLEHAGMYRVCAIAHDNAGNAGTEICSDLNVKKIDVDVDGDGSLDFGDSDEDGCPDLNIDVNGDNIVDVNIDRNHDNLPDLNIDSNGDGIAELNLDTDGDGNPDLNLIQFPSVSSESPTVWKPSYCVTDQPERYCTMQGLKATINMDTVKESDQNKRIPEINIDTDGDMKADFNISKDGIKASINIGKLHEWIPNKDYTFVGFIYDSIAIDSVKPTLNIDTDKDGRPDVNLDINKDGTPELNIDRSGDFIPDTQIDSDGDGKADINIDEDGNGTPDKNVVEIKDWKPEQDSDILDGFPYDTMQIEIEKQKDKLEDNGIVVKDSQGKPYLPNYALKADNITDEIDQSTKDAIEKYVNESSEIKQVYEVHMMKDNVMTQPDGMVEVSIPVDSTIKNPKLVVEKEDGTFEIITPDVKDGMYVYQTKFLGKVSIIGDKIEPTEESKEDPSETPPAETPNTKPPVNGYYVNNAGGMGGAGTGDNTSMIFFQGLILSALLFMIALKAYQTSRNKAPK